MLRLKDARKLVLIKEERAVCCCTGFGVLDMVVRNQALWNATVHRNQFIVQQIKSEIGMRLNGLEEKEHRGIMLIG